MKLAYISAIVSNRDIKECIITTKINNVFESYIGVYEKEIEYTTAKGVISVISFANSICSIGGNECQSMEETDLNFLLQVLIHVDSIIPIKDKMDEKTTYIINKTKNLIKNKKLVGIIASIDEKMKNCTVDIVCDKKVQKFKGPLDITPTLGNNSIIFINLCYTNYILSYLLDDILIDLTATLTYESAIKEVHLISHILTNKKGWTGKIIALEF